LDNDFVIAPESQYLLIVKEDQMDRTYGITILDTTLGTFQMGEIQDDNHRTQFETLVHSLNPKEVLIEKNNISKVSMSVLKSIKTKITSLIPIIEFWDSNSTKDQLTLSQYFKSSENPNSFNFFYSIFR
jgi:DNA mismatch repair protein MSH6